MKRIQVLLHHGFGDFLMAVPVLKVLGRLEGVEVDVVVKDPTIAGLGRRVVGGSGYTWHVVAGGRASWLRLAYRLRQKRPDAFFGIHAQSRFTGLIAWMTGAPIRVGPVRGWGYNRGVVRDRMAFLEHGVYDEKRHKVELYLAFLCAGGLEVPEAVDVKVDLPRDVVEGVLQRFPFLESDGRLVGIAPSSGVTESHKRWPTERFGALIAEMDGDGDDVVIVVLGGPPDTELGQEIERVARQRGSRATIHNLAGATDLVELLAVLQRLSLLVSVCNGPSHAAAAVGTPVVGIYGPTNPGFTGPYTDDLYVVRKGFRCSPCYRAEFKTGCGDPRCMLDITVAEVRQECRAARSGTAPGRLPVLSNSLATRFAR